MFWFHQLVLRLPFAGIGLSNFHVYLPLEVDGHLDAHGICLGSSLPPWQWLFQNPAKNHVISFTHYCFGASLVCFVVWVSLQSQQTRPRFFFHVCFETKFQGREVDKNSHRNEPWIPNRFRTSCWRWQPPLSIVPWQFIRFIEFLWFIPLFLGRFANQENKTRLSVRQKTQEQQTCDFIIWSNYRQLCTETSNY